MKKADQLFPGGEYVNMAEAQFYCGFAEATGLSMAEGKRQWAGFSRNLTDSDRQAVEALGFVNGQKEGRLFRKQFPTDLFK